MKNKKKIAEFEELDVHISAKNNNSLEQCFQSYEINNQRTVIDHTVPGTTRIGGQTGTSQIMSQNTPSYWNPEVTDDCDSDLDDIILPTDTVPSDTIPPVT